MKTKTGQRSTCTDQIQARLGRVEGVVIGCHPGKWSLNGHLSGSSVLQLQDDPPKNRLEWYFCTIFHRPAIHKMIARESLHRLGTQKSVIFHFCFFPSINPLILSHTIFLFGLEFAEIFRFSSNSQGSGSLTGLVFKGIRNIAKSGSQIPQDLFPEVPGPAQSTSTHAQTPRDWF